MDAAIERLKQARDGLVRTYVLHLAWFLAMCCFVAFRWADPGIRFSVVLVLLTVPPVLYYTVRTHHACRALDPKSRTVGLLPVLLTTIVLTPFESGLVLPLHNLLEANRQLRRHAARRR
jgi:hypothetical protein